MQNRRTSLTIAAVLFTSSLTCASAKAQDYVYATGNPNFGVNDPIPGGYINVTNGNVHVTIPLGTFKQRGTLPPIKINLEYDSRIWQIVDNGSYSWQPTNVPNSMAGWRLTTGLEQGTTSYGAYGQQGSQSVTCTVGNLVLEDFTETWTLLTAFQWTDGQGTSHTFNVQTLQPLEVCNGDTSHTVPSAAGYATDGSGYFVKISNYTQMTVYDNAGNEVYPVLQDSNNNQASISSTGTVTDSMGRTLLTTTTGSNSITYNVLKEGGGTNVFTVNTGTINVNTSFGQSAVSENSSALTAINSVELPDGSSYQFTYDADSYGELDSMTLPTGGGVAFNYTNYLDSYNNYNRWISSETENGYATTFAPQVVSQCSSQPTGCQETMTLTRPTGDSRVYNLTMNDGAWDGETDTYQGSTEILKVVNNYNFTSYPCTNGYICTGAEYIAASSSTATLTDVTPNLTATTCYTYADPPGAGKVSAIQEWDYSGSAVSCTSPPTPNRETDYTYGSTLNGALLLTQKSKLFNGAAFEQTSYAYDSQGNMTGKTEGLSGNQATTSYIYDSNGMRTSKTGPNGNTTSYTYISNDGYIAQTTYPQTGGVSHITSAEPDPSTGDPVTTTDQNGQTTKYGYDSIGRKSSIQYPDGGQTSYSYPSPTEVSESKLLSGGASSVVTETWDGYGRKTQVSQSDPAGDDVVTYTYDADNRLLCTSNPQRSGSAPTNGTTCVDYDALDRPTLITQPDGHTLQVSYSGNQATETDEDGSQKRYQYDAFHDLTAIWEPNGSGSPSWETTYTYDPAGHVLNMTQTGDGSSAPRQRTFQYDSLGRLTQETTPEAGTRSYGYDADSNLTSETTPLATISYSYDALNRATQKSSPGFTYTYTYDTSSPVGGFTSTNPIGRLVGATTSSNAGSYYSYDSMGRTLSEGNCLPSNCTASANAVQATYDLAGDLASITYPDGRVISNSYDTARHLTGVEYASWNGQSVGTSYYSATSFAPPGETANATFGSGVQMTASFNSRQSLTALSYATPTQTLWSKQFTWAGNAKNLLQSTDLTNSAQTYSYTYDPDNRLTAASGGGTTLVSPATSGTGSITITGGPDQTTTRQVCGIVIDGVRRCTTETIYDAGTVTAAVGSVSYSVYYNSFSTTSSLASAIAAAIAADSSSVVTAAASGATIYLTAKATGTSTDYALSASAATSETAYFSRPSFEATLSGAELAGGANAVYSGAGVLAETYSLDAWGNMQQSGNFAFNESFTASNQVLGFSYDAAGDLLSDGLDTYTYDDEGMLTSTGGAQYIYDALQQRVEKSGGSDLEEVVYFNGQPLALLNPSSGAWTDLIWAGVHLLAEVPGSQTASPTYRLLNHEGSLAATTDASGNLTGTNLLTPYGQLMASSTTDPYVYTGLYQDTEYSGDAAWYRDLSTRQARWLSPDPDNGSYDLYNPQSFNRYMYVNGNPLGYTDPSGLAGAGILTGVGGAPCKAFGAPTIPVGFGLGLNPCNPVGSLIADGAALGAAAIDAWQTGVSISSILSTSPESWSTSPAGFANGYGSVLSGIAASVGAAITIGCSIDSNSDLCGQTGWTGALIGGDGGKVVGDSIAVAGAVACFAGPEACLGYGIYTIANGLFSVFWDLFGPPQFTGSLLPRPSDLGGLGTAPTGIPNQNLSVSQLLGSQSTSPVLSPGIAQP